jgi:hypothetical protein
MSKSIIGVGNTGNNRKMHRKCSFDMRNTFRVKIK